MLIFNFQKVDGRYEIVYMNLLRIYEFSENIQI